MTVFPFKVHFFPLQFCAVCPQQAVAQLQCMSNSAANKLFIIDKE